MDFIERSLDELLMAEGDVAVVFGGDFNQLNVLELSSRTGLTPLVNVPTRNNNILDMLMASPGASYHIKVITSTVRTDHRAVLATTGEQVKDRAKKSEKRLYRRRTPGQHTNLLQHLRNFDDSLLVSIPDPQLAWDAFYHLTLKWLDDYYPLWSVTVTSREPAFMTPDIKYLLRRKNPLIKQGKLEEASAMAAKIGRSIARSNSRHLRDLDTSHGTKNLWRSVNNLTKVKSTTQPSSQVTAEELNAHYASTSTDIEYVPPSLRLTAAHNVPMVSEPEIFRALDQLRHTTAGHDQLPAWFLRLLAPICSHSLTYIVNLSLQQSCVPSQWKTAIIHPAPKVPSPSTPADYRPISVVPILSRIVERFIVHAFIYPAFHRPPIAEKIKDQFAFRPTGSTTASIIDLLQQISTMLQTNEYVAIIHVDYSKAFDTVSHSSLMLKMCTIDISDQTYNWVVNYFNQRAHIRPTNHRGIMSCLAMINASVIQGSVLGPSSFIV